MFLIALIKAFINSTGKNEWVFYVDFNVSKLSTTNHPLHNPRHYIVVVVPSSMAFSMQSARLENSIDK